MSRAPAVAALLAFAWAASPVQAQDAVDHSKMDHSKMDHSKMGHAPPPAPEKASDEEPAPARETAAPQEAAATLPREPIPPITDADRAAARLPVGGHAAHGDSIHGFVAADRLEAWQSDDAEGAAWELEGWIGRDVHKFRFRTEGETEGGDADHAEIDLLYARGVTPWWDAVVGLHHEAEPVARQALAVGVLGLAPYKIETQAMLYLGEDGAASLRLELEYDTLLTNRWILQSLVEVHAESRTDAERHVGAGLSRVEAGVRLRYELHRQFAPYVGLVREQSFGVTADQLRAEGDRAGDWRWVIGLRTWF